MPSRKFIEKMAGLHASIGKVAGENINGKTTSAGSSTQPTDSGMCICQILEPTVRALCWYGLLVFPDAAFNCKRGKWKKRVGRRQGFLRFLYLALIIINFLRVVNGHLLPTLDPKYLDSMLKRDVDRSGFQFVPKILLLVFAFSVWLCFFVYCKPDYYLQICELWQASVRCCSSEDGSFTRRLQIVVRMWIYLFPVSAAIIHSLESLLSPKHYGSRVWVAVDFVMDLSVAGINVASMGWFIAVCMVLRNRFRVVTICLHRAVSTPEDRSAVHRVRELLEEHLSLSSLTSKLDVFFSCYLSAAVLFNLPVLSMQMYRLTSVELSPLSTFSQILVFAGHIFDLSILLMGAASFSTAVSMLYAFTKLGSSLSVTPKGRGF